MPCSLRCCAAGLRRMSASSNAMNIALSFISDDPYYLTVEARYLRGVGDYDIAERLNCDPSTVRRNRHPAGAVLALRLYGMGGGACGSSF